MAQERLPEAPSEIHWPRPREANSGCGLAFQPAVQRRCSETPHLADAKTWNDSIARQLLKRLRMDPQEGRSLVAVENWFEELLKLSRSE
jgi:hypothetical protein